MSKPNSDNVLVKLRSAAFAAANRGFDGTLYNFAADEIERLRGAFTPATLVSATRAELEGTECELSDAVAALNRSNDLLTKCEAEREVLRGLLAQCVPHIRGNVGAWDEMSQQVRSPTAVAEALDRVSEGLELLRVVEGAVGGKHD